MKRERKEKKNKKERRVELIWFILAFNFLVPTIKAPSGIRALIMVGAILLGYSILGVVQDIYNILYRNNPVRFKRSVKNYWRWRAFTAFSWIFVIAVLLIPAFLGIAFEFIIEDWLTYVFRGIVIVAIFWMLLESLIKIHKKLYEDNNNDNV